MYPRALRGANESREAPRTLNGSKHSRRRERGLQIPVLEGRSHSVDLGRGNTETRRLSAPGRHCAAYLDCDPAGRLRIKLKIRRHLHCSVERGGAVFEVDGGRQNSRLDVGRHRIEVVGGRKPKAAPIVATSPDSGICRKTALLWGIIPRLVEEREFDRPEDLARRSARDLGLGVEGQTVLLVRGFGGDPSLAVVTL